MPSPGGKRSLRLRLSLFFAAFLVFAWSLSAIAAWSVCKNYIDEFFDTQQMLFAKHMAALDFQGVVRDLPGTRELLPHGGKGVRGRQDDDALAFAVFTREGALVMSDGENGQRFLFQPGTRGFIDARIAHDDDDWRIVWLDSLNGKHVVAVGQEMEYREDMVAAMLADQLVPWVLLLPVLFGGLVLLLTRELAPLRAVAGQLRGRTPGDGDLLDAGAVPSETRPLVDALNGFITRTNAMFRRERAFISDAAHELRTPLAGLRIQAQVAAQPGVSPETRQEALGNMVRGIDRSGRLVEQLLVLSRLESMEKGPGQPQPASGGMIAAPLDWPALVDEAVREYAAKAEKKNVAITTHAGPVSVRTDGYPVLVAMLLRNLLDNAVAYTPAGGVITIRQEGRILEVFNEADPLPAEVSQRLGERFFRPPGQAHPGSGLGLSIIRRIADIHGFGLDVESGEAGFRVTLVW